MMMEELVSFRYVAAATCLREIENAQAEMQQEQTTYIDVPYARVDL